MRTGGLGDTILVLPALTWLRERLVKAHLTFVGTHWAEALLPLFPSPLEVVRFDSPRLTRVFGSGPVADTSGMFAEADAVIIYTATPEGDWIRNVSHACQGPVITWPIIPAGKCHAALHFAQALAGASLESSDVPTPTLRVPLEPRAWAEAWWKVRFESGGPPVAIHAGSGGARKCWPAEQFAELAGKLAAPILLIEGPADAGACSRVRALMSSAVPVVEARGLSLLETAALIEQCKLYVGNDSGLAHLAAALGIPTVAVFGPTDPSVWAPLGRRVEAVCSKEGAAWPTLNTVLEAVARLQST